LARPQLQKGPNSPWSPSCAAFSSNCSASSHFLFPDLPRDRATPYEPFVILSHRKSSPPLTPALAVNTPSALALPSAESRPALSHPNLSPHSPPLGSVFRLRVTRVTIFVLVPRNACLDGWIFFFYAPFCPFWCMTIDMVRSVFHLEGRRVLFFTPHLSVF